MIVHIKREQALKLALGTTTKARVLRSMGFSFTYWPTQVVDKTTGEAKDVREVKLELPSLQRRKSV